MTPTEILDTLADSWIDVSIRTAHESHAFIVELAKGKKKPIRIVDASFDKAINEAYKQAIEKGFIHDKPQYTDQCRNCMYRHCHQVLQVCKESESEYRHREYNGLSNQCVYKMHWDSYGGEAHWKRMLTPGDYQKAYADCVTNTMGVRDLPRPILRHLKMAAYECYNKQKPTFNEENADKYVDDRTVFECYKAFRFIDADFPKDIQK